MGDILNKAVAFAVGAHAGQCRKGTQVPYILHPMEAAVIVGSMTADDEVLAAAVLHDVAEDTDFTVEDMNGNKVKLSDFLGKPIVLNFWTSWCGYCKREMPDFDRAAKENPNVAFVMVNITRDSRETIGKAKAYVRSNNFENLNFYFDVDKEAAIEYQVRAYPSTYFFNTDGTLVAGAESSLSYEELIDCMKLITPIK